MSVSDRSQTERIRRMRAQIQAVARATCPTCLEEGPQGPVDQSTRLSRMFGQMIYYKQSCTGAVVPTGCCASSPTACSVNFYYYIAYSILNGAPLDYNVSFTINTNGTITLTFIANGIISPPITTQLYYITSNTTDPNRGVYVNSSNSPITLTSGPIVLTLNPCAAFFLG